MTELRSVLRTFEKIITPKVPAEPSVSLAFRRTKNLRRRKGNRPRTMFWCSPLFPPETADARPSRLEDNGPCRRLQRHHHGDNFLVLVENLPSAESRPLLAIIMNRNNRIGGSFGYSRRASSTSGSNERHNTSIIELLDSDDDDDDADAGLWAAPSIFASSSSSAVKREGSSSINSGRGISTATAPRSGNSGGSSFSAAKVNDKAERKGLGREGGGGGGASTASTTAGAAADVATGPSTSSDASTSVQTPLGHLDVRCEETTADASASSSEQAMLVDPPSGTAVCFRRITEVHTDRQGKGESIALHRTCLLLGLTCVFFVFDAVPRRHTRTRARTHTLSSPIARRFRR